MRPTPRWRLLVRTAVAATATSSAYRCTPAIALAFGGRDSHSSPGTTNGRFLHSTTVTTTARRPRSSLFESVRNGYYRNTNRDEVPLEKLLEKAANVLRNWNRNASAGGILPSSSSSSSSGTALDGLLSERGLFFPSSYSASRKHATDGDGIHPNTTERGFSNWIIPGKLMVGQYPGRVPEKSTPTQNEVEEHLETVLNAAVEGAGEHISSSSSSSTALCFVSLQSELPPQDDYDSWNQHGGEIYLGDPESRKNWPNPFSHYAPVLDSMAAKRNDSNQNSETVAVRYLHHSIRDLSVPSTSNQMRLLLWKLLDVLDASDGRETYNHHHHHQTMVYIHCWGGRGRAGLTACCLLTLLNFASENTTPSSLQTVFDIVQTGYESRIGSEHMPLALSRSPQTDSQRAFVTRFFEEVREAAQHANTNANANENTQTTKR